MLSVAAVFLDFGETLVRVPREQIMARLLAQKGVQVPQPALARGYQVADEYWRTHLQPWTDEVARTIDAIVLREAQVQGKIEDLAAYVQEHWFDIEWVEAYPDAQPCLHQLLNDGFPLGVISNIRSRELLAQRLREVGLDSYFECLVASGTEGVEKPDARIFRVAVERMGVSPAVAIHIGDSYEADVVGAQQAGLMSVLIDRSNRDAARPCLRVQTLVEFPRLLQRAPITR